MTKHIESWLPAAVALATALSVSASSFQGATLIAAQTAPARANCRIYPTSAVNVSQGGDGTVTLSYSGTYDSGSNRTTYNVTYTDSTGRNFSYTQATSYRSEADVVDEVSVLPPITRALGTTATSAIPFETTNQYDAQGRLTGITSQGGGATIVITYTAWDAAGRPTAGANSTGGPFTIAYDESARTATTSSSIGTETQSYDENGNPSQLVQSYGGTTVTTRTTIKSTGQVCR